LEGELGTALNELSESQRLLEIRDQQLQDLQAQLAAAQDTEARLAEQVAAVTPPAAVTRVVVPPIQPSLLSRVLGWLTRPILLIGLGLLALLGTAVWYLRFRRQDTDDVTGRWEALESDLGDDTDSLEATARLREPVDTEETIDIDEQNVVVEGEEAAFELLSEPLETSAAETKSWPDSESDISDAASGETLTIGIPPEEESTEDTISSQTIIDLDIGDFSTPDDDATLLAAGNDDASLLALRDQDATMLAPGVDDDLWDGTQHMEQSPDEDLGLDDSSADVSADAGSNIDLDLDDLTSALEESDTVEQPMAQSVGSDLSVGIGSADVTLDIGSETPTGDAASAESPRILDPHTMTMAEVGTKLDLARAYVDMGDSDGARSILEEVLEEGDDAQQKEAQGIIDAL
jgi:pilus assembly protein FimV